MSFNKKVYAIVLSPVNEINQLSELVIEYSFAVIDPKSSLRELRRAMDDVLVGGQYISTNISKSILTELNKITQGRKGEFSNDILTKRENEIAILISRGLTTKEISEQLKLSVDTISTHRKHILKKLGLKNSSSLTNHIINHSYYSGKGNNQKG